MKKILLIADTHSYVEPRLLKYISACDEIWHAGDIGEATVANTLAQLKPFRAVYGNIDSAAIRGHFPENLIFECEGVKVVMTHIGGYPGKFPARIQQLLVSEKPNLFVCGHSHILKVAYDKAYQVLCMNPGACGVHGFHNVKTALRFNIHETKIEQLEVIELGKRAGEERTFI